MSLPKPTRKSVHFPVGRTSLYVQMQHPYAFRQWLTAYTEDHPVRMSNPFTQRIGVRYLPTYGIYERYSPGTNLYEYRWPKKSPITQDNQGGVNMQDILNLATPNVPLKKKTFGSVPKNYTTVMYRSSVPLCCGSSILNGFSSVAKENMDLELKAQLDAYKRVGMGSLVTCIVNREQAANGWCEKLEEHGFVCLGKTYNKGYTGTRNPLWLYAKFDGVRNIFYNNKDKSFAKVGYELKDDVSWETPSKVA